MTTQDLDTLVEGLAAQGEVSFGEELEELLTRYQQEKDSRNAVVPARWYNSEPIKDQMPPCVTSGPLSEKSLEERTLRELNLRNDGDQWDERTAVERLMDVILRARMLYYRPHADPSERNDIPCLCCGRLYRPDDPLDARNMFLCLGCIYVTEGR